MKKEKKKERKKERTEEREVEERKSISIEEKEVDLSDILLSRFVSLIFIPCFYVCIYTTLFGFCLFIL